MHIQRIENKNSMRFFYAQKEVDIAKSDRFKTSKKGIKNTVIYGNP